jgi:glutamyl-tRNA synthetase
MVNFLALLGWGTGSDEELFTRDELIARFSLEGISGGSAVFNTEKLDWFNHQHLLRLPDGELLRRIAAWQAQYGLRPAADGLGADPAWIAKVLALLRPRCKKLGDFVEQLAPFVEDPSSYDVEGVKAHLSAPATADHLRALREAYATVSPFEESSLEQTLRSLADARGIKAGALIHAARLAVTGRMVSPGLFQMLVLLGRDRVVRRLDRLVGFIEDRQS